MMAYKNISIFFQDVSRETKKICSVHSMWLLNYFSLFVCCVSLLATWEGRVFLEKLGGACGPLPKTLSLF